MMPSSDGWRFVNNKLFAILLAIAMPLNAGMDFAESDNIVTITSTNYGTAHTFTCWINWRDTGDGVVIGRDDSGIFCRYFLYMDTTTMYYGSCSAAVSSNFVSVTRPTLTSGRFYHIAVVRNGTSVSFYVNGVQQGTTQTLGSNLDLDPITTIGNYGGVSNNFPANMQLLEIQIYDYAMTANQIAGLYGAKSYTSYGTPLNWWRFDEGESGLTATLSGGIKDRGTASNHGTGGQKVPSIPESGPTFISNGRLSYQ